MLYSHIHVQAALRIYCHFCILFLVINIAPIECLQNTLCLNGFYLFCETMKNLQKLYFYQSNVILLIQNL